jgi:hypothetical protein
VKTTTRSGVTVTLVFACESHREAWLVLEGVIAPEAPPKNENSEYVFPNNMPRAEQKLLAKRIDYERRRNNTDLVFEVGATMKCPVCNADAAYILDNDKGCERCTRDCTLEEVTAMLAESNYQRKLDRNALLECKEHLSVSSSPMESLEDCSVDDVRHDAERTLGLVIDRLAATGPEVAYRTVKRGRARMGYGGG